MSSGGKAGGASAMKDYYASFAGIAGWGPAERLVGLVVDKEEVWRPETPIERSASANPYVLDVESHGRVYIYWGTDDQELSDSVLAAYGHPPYRRRILCVFKDFLCGRERTAVPDIQVIYHRRPQQSVITGASAELDGDGQANPLAALAELITHPVTGLGRDAALLHGASWQGQADALDPAHDYLSIDLSAQEAMRDLINHINGYLDLWFRLNDAGEIEVGRFLQGDSFPTGLPELTAADMVNVPEIDKREVGDSRTELRFVNRDRLFEEDIARFNGLAVQEDFETERVSEWQRPWVRRAAQAARMAARIGARNATEWDALSVSVRPEKCLSLRPGDLVWFNYAPLSYRQLSRIVQRAGFGDGPAQSSLELETERVHPPPAAAVPEEIPFVEPADVVDASNWYPLQATPELAGDAYRLLALVGKDQDSLRGFHFYFQAADAEQYVHLGSTGAFAVPVKIAAVFPDDGPDDDTTGDLKIERFPEPEPFGFDRLPTSQGADEVSDDNLLLFLIDSSAPASYEILTIKSIESPVDGLYPIHALRGRLGTTKQAFTGVDAAFFILRRQIDFFTHRALPGLASADNSASIKLRPFSAWRRAPLADSSARELPIEVQAQIGNITADSDVI